MLLPRLSFWPLRPRLRVRRSLGGALFVAILYSGAPVARAADMSLEYPIKATFLQKFTDFVTWPTPPTAPTFSVCVYGTDPFGRVLDDTVKGHSAAGRPMLARRVNDTVAASTCDILYIGKTAEPARSIINAVSGKPVLTVTDARTSDTRGIIHFVIEQNRVRFAIDNDAAEANGLEISAKLLAIAINASPARPSP